MNSRHLDNTQKTRDAIKSLNPLCELRYSATHREKINLLYRLTPIDAYQMNLVKQISVSSSQVEGSHNKPCIKLLSAEVEKPFAMALDKDPRVKMFFKIPRHFKIDTPLGTYNPDWAVYMEDGARGHSGGDKKMYFVIETKGSTFEYDLRSSERLKINCGKAHFKALDPEIKTKVATRWSEIGV